MNIAVFIDGDNVCSAYLPQISSMMSKLGALKVCKVFGNKVSSKMQSWIKLEATDDVQLVQVYPVSKSKNACDMALVIDVMDSLHQNAMDKYVIVSCDGDFSSLALRIRQAGKDVIGIGHQQVSSTFFYACDEFMVLKDQKKTDTTNSIQTKVLATSVKIKVKKNKKNKTKKKNKVKKSLRNLVDEAYSSADQNGSCVNLGALGREILKIDTAFTPKIWGYKNLSTMMVYFDDYYKLSKEDSGMTVTKLN